VTLGVGVTTIGDWAFYGCTGLTSVTIPAGVTTIGSLAFENCTRLTSVFFLGDAPYFNDYSPSLSDSKELIVYHLEGTSGWPPVPNAWMGQPTALWTGALIGVSGNLAFGNVVTGRTATATLTITNSGNSTLTVTSIGYSNRFTGAWSGNIAAGHSTNVTVTFAPVALAMYQCTVTVNSENTIGENMISASGTGTEWFPEMRCDASFGIVSNRYGFNVDWASGRVVVVEASTDLNTTNWLPIATNTLTGVPWYFSDSSWTNSIGRFYRLRSMP
jgi:hypothetical protein